LTALVIGRWCRCGVLRCQTAACGKLWMGENSKGLGVLGKDMESKGKGGKRFQGKKIVLAKRGLPGTMGEKTMPPPRECVITVCVLLLRESSPKRSELG